VQAFFPEPQYYISMVHGKQPVDMKETNMQRFVTGDTQIMVATTVIEVGVNVPNASVMDRKHRKIRPFPVTPAERPCGQGRRAVLLYPHDREQIRR